MVVYETLPGEFCRKSITGIQLSAEAGQDIEGIKSLWQTCRAEFGSGGEWLFGENSIADAMFAPVALRFAGYNITLDGVVKDYVQTVLEQPCVIEWIAAAKAETEVIADDEIDASQPPGLSLMFLCKTNNYWAMYA